MTQISTLVNRSIDRRPYPALAPLALLAALFAQTTLADTPPGWVNSDNTSAFTTNNGELEFDFAGLAGDSGELAGTRLEIHYGITDWLAVFYQEQSQLLDVELGEIDSVNVVNMDTSLQTMSRRLGLKWIFYAQESLGLQNPKTAAALEIATFSDQSNDFEVFVDAINLSNVTTEFNELRTIAVNDLQDSGWEARFLYSTALSNGIVASAWAGYRYADSSSATGSDIPTDLVPDTFNQTYLLESAYWMLGASLNFSLSPRLPIMLGYEHFKRNNLNYSLDPPRIPEQVPGFLQSDAMRDDTNNIFTGKVSWWVTRRLHVSLSAKHFSNQFYGLIPHFNNPLTGASAEESYGYVGLALGYSLRGL